MFVHGFAWPALLLFLFESMEPWMFFVVFDHLFVALHPILQMPILWTALLCGIGALSFTERLSRLTQEMIDDAFGFDIDIEIEEEENSACKFHTDPEHGTLWHRLTCVVSAGDSEVRKFAFRPIPQMNEWSKYETKKGRNAVILKKPDDAIIPAVIPLFPGDVVKMDNECNDVFHHAVYGRQSLGNSNPSRQSDGRVSLVFKKAIDRGNGKKGHGRGRSTRRL